MQVWTYTLISVLIVSLISLIGIFVFSWKSKKFHEILIFLVSFAAGTLLGDAFLHLIPEAMEKEGVYVSFLVLVGFMIFFILEKFLHWRHCHDEHCEKHEKVLPYVIFFGDAIHNFIDGVIIAVSYLVSIPIGIATTLAVIMHEIPQEIGDFGVLLYAGFTKKKALIYNFISAISAVVGAIVTLLISLNIESIANALVPVAAGGFIYIASADMIPELHKNNGDKISHSILQLIFMGFGIAMMAALLLFE